MNDAYQVSAAHYDELYAGHTVPMRAFIRQFVRERDIRCVCDFACGTGSLMAELTLDRVVAYGCDLSEAMCEIARDKIKTSTECVVVREDMLRYRPPAPVDLAICMFDSINNLLKLTDWLAFFANVSNSTRASGYFIFDYVTRNDIVECWPGHHVACEGSEWALVRLCEYDAERCVGVERMFWHDWRDGRWHSREEVHAHAAFTSQEIVDGLAHVGFSIDDMRDADTGGAVDQESTTRVMVVARKDVAA